MLNEKIYVTWEEVTEFVNNVAKKVEEKGLNISGVYGLPRGGLVLAVMLSHKLHVPMLMAPAANAIIVDDIADSGRSLIHYTENDTQFNKFFIATMYYHPRSLVEPDYWIYNKEDNWIVFPWEV